jgi:alginate O-acetyltransferase complex protein AlgI
VLFNSVQYLLFFLSALALCWLLVGIPRLRIWVLLLASYYFYAANNHWMIVLILVSTQVDYIAALVIDRSDSQARRKLYLLLSLLTNLGILGFFKYCNFFADSVVSLADSVGWPVSWTDLNIVLPVGISFYTFQSMSYTVDVYRRQIPAETDWAKFAFYVAYFPQLIAGPIMRASHFLPQVQKQPRLPAAALERALFLIFTGLFKKIVCGDFLGRYADPVFDNPQDAGAVAAWLGLYAFSFQIYFDFSGYSDIAIGCSRLMGFDLPDNFRRPYMAKSFSDFWRRWHISLSSWLRDYLYIPLGGNRMTTRWGVQRNLMLTMLLGGLWHGAAWHFVFWGALHGAYLVIERARGWTVAGAEGSGFGLVRRLAIFHAVMLTWLLFRAESVPLLGQYIRQLLSFEAPSAITLGMILAASIIVLGWLAQVVGERRELRDAFLGLPIPLQGALYATAWVTIMVFNAAGAQPFIYFRF